MIKVGFDGVKSTTDQQPVNACGCGNMSYSTAYSGTCNCGCVNVSVVTRVESSVHY